MIITLVIDYLVVDGPDRGVLETSWKVWATGIMDGAKKKAWIQRHREFSAVA